MNLIISTTNIISGAEYVLIDYLNNTNIGKDNFLLLTTDDKNILETYKINDINVLGLKQLSQVGFFSSRNPKSIIKKILNLLIITIIFKKIIINNNIKKIVGNNTGDCIYSFIIKKILKFKNPYFLFIHDIVKVNSFLSKIIRVCDNSVDKYFAVSEAVKLNLIKIGIQAEKIEVIYNGMKYNQNFHIKNMNKELNLGFIGNIEERKDPLKFIEIINLFKNQNLEVKGEMVFKHFDSILLDKIKKNIFESGNDIKLIGEINRDEMKNFFNKLDFLIVTSKNDPLPTVILEAFNNGIPVIGNDIDGIPEMIEDNKTGFLYKNDKELLDIILKIKSMTNDEYKKMSEKANLSIKKKFALEKKVEKLDKELR
ncbi:MAG: hypothetical protein PWP46_2172 [Fusobacteriaceae bacterium]|nr:hypothetical protein [Fusobacteriaceae bacterium]